MLAYHLDLTYKRMHLLTRVCSNILYCVYVVSDSISCEVRCIIRGLAILHYIYSLVEFSSYNDVAVNYIHTQLLDLQGQT